jgi:hypothetical protein
MIPRIMFWNIGKLETPREEILIEIDWWIGTDRA